MGSLIAALAAAAGFALAGEALSSKIEGSFYAAGPGCDGGISKPCKVNIQVYGDLARFLYQNMQSDPHPDPCVEGFGKSDKALYCSRNGKGQYQCDVGYDFLREELVRSDVTC
jgi:hypothetical protein